ncbi:MAG: NUDIX hydrolase [Candidatus Bipolaricaulota bacterium]
MTKSGGSKDPGLEEKTIRERKEFGGNLLTLTVNEVRDPEGRKGRREVVHHPGGVVIVPRLQDESGDRLVLVKQYREPAGQTLWEFPAGTLEEGETRRECARRELIEETGYKPLELEKKVDLYTSPGYSDEVLSLYLATDIEVVEGSEKIEAPEDENLEVGAFPANEVLERANKGEIKDGKTLAGLFYLSQPS